MAIRGRKPKLLSPVGEMLRNRGITAPMLGKYLKISRQSAHRMMTTGPISKERLKEIADWIGVPAVSLEHAGEELSPAVLRSIYMPLRKIIDTEKPQLTHEAELRIIVLLYRLALANEAEVTESRVREYVNLLSDLAK